MQFLCTFFCSTKVVEDMEKNDLQKQFEILIMVLERRPTNRTKMNRVSREKAPSEATAISE